MRPSDFELVIGLEVHCQLKTRSKLFAPCAFSFGNGPNEQSDPVSWALPGVLPVPNALAVEYAVRLGLAVGAEIAPKSRWARKHYFYPDSPYGYQITQHDQPYCRGGAIVLPPDETGQSKRIRLHHIHMEADAGKNIHVDGQDVSWVDYNRAGAPLVEIVSFPDLRSAADAAAYLREIRTLVRALGISDANMEEGTLRCDANVSLRPRGSETFGTRCEIKNLNSFRFVESAIASEARRQFDLLEQGKPVVQSTLAYDTERDRTWVMRSKEDAADYLYFPEPDMPPLLLDEAYVAAVKANLPELPAARFERYLGLGLTADDARLLIADSEVGAYFEEVLKSGVPAKKACNWLLVELVGRLNRDQSSIADCKLRPQALAKIVGLIEESVIGGPAAKKVFELCYASGDEPLVVVEREGLRQVSDSGAIEAIVRDVVAAHPKQVADVLAGQVKVRGFLIGQIMKRSSGQANPQLANEILDRVLQS
jgi:aspartyl-tRNA(Asn)/glutamyl-tRNA(Gln) amidotransferase subunit B